METSKMKKWFVILLISLGVVLLSVTLLKTPLLRLYYPLKYQEDIQNATEENQLPYGLMYAVIHTESKFHPEAVSEVGARGLMQITEETFEWVRYRKNDLDTEYADLFDPAVNIRYGGWLLGLLLEEFGTVENVLCAYHAGWGAASQWRQDRNYSPDGVHITNIPYPSTAHYQYKVLRAWDKYQELYQIKESL